jgi:uncharacterized protein
MQPTSYLDYADRGLHAGWRYVVGLVVACAATLLLAILILLPLQLSGVLPADWVTRAQDPGHPATFFLFLGATFGCLALGFAAATRWIHRKTPADLLGDWSWRMFGLGAAIWLIALVAAALVDFAVAPAGFRLTASSETPKLLLAALAGLAIQTFSEELIFRGYVTQGLLHATRRAVPTALISGLIFGAIHIPNGTPQAVSATFFGIVLALVAIRTRSIAFGSGLHLVNNLFGAVVVVSGGDAFRGSPGLFSQNTPHLMWWDMAVGTVALFLVGGLVLRRFPNPAPAAAALPA